MLKTKQLKFWFLFFACTSTFAQLDVPYFQKLQTEKVTSSDKLVWTQFGPGTSGYTEFFWCHPTDASTIHMAPDMFNAYGSFDGGNSWQTILDYDGNPKDMSRTYDIEFSRQNPNLGFATDELGGLFKTTDKGKSWQKQSFSLGKAHNEISVDPSNDNNWFIGAGTFWDVKRNHRTEANKTGVQRSTAVTGHIYRSTNKGASWEKITAGLPSSLSVCKILVNPKNSNKILMAANTGVYKSIDGGKTWNSSNTGLPNNAPKDMVYYYDASNNTLMYYLIEQTKYYKSGNTYASTGGIYRSTNAGDSWTSITGDLAIDLTQINSNTTKNFYKKTVAHWLGVDKSTIGNTYPTSILPTYNRIVINPNNPQEIYISHNVKHDYSFGPGDVWKTINGGKNWFPATRTGSYWSNETDKNYWNNVRNTPKISINTKFAHLQHEMEIREELWGCRFLSINSNGDLFISLDQQILKSTDQGANWTQIDDIESSPGSKIWTGKGGSNLPGRMMLVETGIPGRKLFCSGEHGLWKSANSGSNQRPIAITQIEGQVNPGGAHSTGAVAVHPTNPDIIYTVQNRQNHRDDFRKSTDGGATWNNIGEVIDYPNTNLSQDVMHWNSLLVDKNAPNKIILCLTSNPISEVGGFNKLDHGKFGVYKSTNGGASWNLSNSGLPEGCSVNRMALFPSNNNTVYAALNNGRNGVKGGLYRSYDSASTWNKINTLPADVTSINNIFINPSNNDIYIACGSFSGTAAQGGIWKSTDKAATWVKIFEMPQVWQVEVSKKNNNIFVATVGRHKDFLNGGAYISRNGGTTWIKVSKNLANHDRITDIKTDPDDENVFWLSELGSGWYRGQWYPSSTPPSTGDEHFYILNRQTSKKIRPSNDTDGATLIQVPSSWSGDFTRWKTIDTDNNYFYLQNIETGMYFRPDGDLDRDALNQRPTNYTGTYTQWKKVTTTDGYFYLQNRETGMYFRPETDADNAIVIQRPISYSGNWTQWKFEYISGSASKENFKKESNASDISKSIRIYPNPSSSGNIHIALPEETRATITIFNINGSQVYQGIHNSSTSTISTNNLKNGMYFVEIQTGTQKLVHKLIIK